MAKDYALLFEKSLSLKAFVCAVIRDTQKRERRRAARIVKKFVRAYTDKEFYGVYSQEQIVSEILSTRKGKGKS